MSSLPRGVIVLLTLAGLGIVAIVASELFIPPSPEARLRRLRGQLRTLRAAADSCRSALDREEARLQTMDERLDSLRERIGAYESLDPRGVPADSYDAYLEAFQKYNRGIPERGAVADSLEAHWRSCRTITGRHNRLADSARALAEELELLPDPRKPGTPR